MKTLISQTTVLSVRKEQQGYVVMTRQSLSPLTAGSKNMATFSS